MCEASSADVILVSSAASGSREGDMSEAAAAAATSRTDVSLEVDDCISASVLVVLRDRAMSKKTVYFLARYKLKWPDICT